MADKLSTDVKIKGKKVSTAGSIAKHNDPMHMQLPGTIKFQNNPKEEGEVTGGTEKSVKANGYEIAHKKANEKYNWQEAIKNANV